MNFGSVCSGIEAASVAWRQLGWRAAWFSEIEPFPSAVLAHHYPGTPNLGDMTGIARRVLTGEVEAPDVLCGGTPCQAFSVAGLRESLNDDRGNLTLTFCELADAIDFARTRAGHPPAIVFWENVPGVLSTRDNAFGCFLAGLAGEDGALEPPGGKWTNAGCVHGPARTVAWRTLDAQYFGLAQRRRRVFVVASARNGFDPAQVLFEWDGVRRDSAPSREAGKDAAGSAGDGIARCVTAGEMKRQDWETCNFVAHSLRGEGFDASDGGTGRGTPLAPAATDLFNGAITGGVAATIGTRGSSQNSSGPTVMVPLAHAFDARQSNVIQYGDRTGPLDTDGHTIGVLAFSAKDHGADAGEIAPTLRAMGHGGSHANGGGQVAVLAFDSTQVTSPANRSNPQPGDPCHPLAAGAHAPAVATAMAVRRLTPRECERLMGFPDDYTSIPWRTYQEAQRKGISYETLLAQRGMTLRGPSIEECPDSPRYKALGNSWAVPVARWIGERIRQQLGTKETGE